MLSNVNQVRVYVLTAINWTRVTCCWGQPEMKTVQVKYCWNYAKILPAAVMATGPKDAVLNEIAGGWTAG